MLRLDGKGFYSVNLREVAKVIRLRELTNMFAMLDSFAVTCVPVQGEAYGWCVHISSGYRIGLDSASVLYPRLPYVSSRLVRERSDMSTHRRAAEISSRPVTH